ncbi:hypothetical protein AOLI_G00224510 [Acnodon oligacanthus]
MHTEHSISSQKRPKTPLIVHVGAEEERGSSSVKTMNGRLAHDTLVLRISGQAAFTRSITNTLPGTELLHAPELSPAPSPAFHSSSASTLEAVYVSSAIFPL